MTVVTATGMALGRADRASGQALPLAPLVGIGTAAEDRARLGELLGTGLPFSMVRTPSSMTTRDSAAGRRVALGGLAPAVFVTWNSAIPFSLNDGALWAGRGVSVLARAGVAVTIPHLRVIAAPEFTYSQNRPFEIRPGLDSSRSAYSSPWHAGHASADLPLRFGDEPVILATLGQSSVTATGGPLAFGLSTENQWWGPGIRNAIVMSNNAEGIVHAFVRTARPLDTPAGTLEARWMLGGLTESLFFDTVSANDLRAVDGLALALRPRGTRGLTVGLARLVVAPTTSRGEIARHAADVFTTWRTAPRRGAADSVARRDQLTSLFARWAPPGGGVEVYGEWARSEMPRSLREFLLAPQHTQAFTVGLQWARALRSPGRALRLQAEATTVEQSVAITGRGIPPDYYTGAAAPQGFTQRGQVIGAAIGPGGSDQWLAFDVFDRGWQLGAFVTRIRWENDALYRQLAPNFFRHDVSVVGGVRAARRIAAYDVAADLALGDRLNYLFQNAAFDQFRTVDVHNVTVGLRVTPR